MPFKIKISQLYLPHADSSYVLETSQNNQSKENAPEFALYFSIIYKCVKVSLQNGSLILFRVSVYHGVTDSLIKNDIGEVNYTHLKAGTKFSL